MAPSKATEQTQHANDADFARRTKHFDEEFMETASEHDNATQMYYSKNSGQYSTRTVNEFGEFSFPRACKNVDQYEAILVESARKYAGTWVGPSIGDAGDGEAPDCLNTNIRTIYQQFGRRYCLCYSLASAVFYCGFQVGAEMLAVSADPISKMNLESALSKVRELMQAGAPVIGLATLYGVRTKSSCRVKRKITWKELFTEVTPYPTLVIPLLPNGATTHAFCIVDDLIFDAITPFALKLCEESVRWIFNDIATSLFQVLRFQTKISPEGHKLREKYTRQVTFHWDHPARPK